MLSNPASSTRRDVQIFLGILALAALLRIGCVIAIPSVLESDYAAYWSIAQNIADGRGLVDDAGKQTAFYNLGYPMFLAGPLQLFGVSIAVAKALNVLLGVGSTALLYCATRQLFGSSRIAAVGAALFAVYLESVIYATYVAKENLMMFLMLVQIALAVWNATGRQRYLSAVVFGIATGAVAMVGNAAVILLPALALQVFFTQGNLANAARYLSVAALTTILVIAPLMVRNHHIFGAYVLNNGGGVNLYLGNNERSTPFYQHPEDSPLGAEWARLRADLGESGMDAYLAKIATQYIKSHPIETVELALRKAVVFWNPPTHAGKYQEGILTRLVRAGWLGEYCAIGLLFLWASVNAVRLRQREFVFLWLMIASYTAEHMVFYVIYRYRLPIMPVLCMGAAVGVSHIAAQIGRKGSGSERQGMRQTA